MPNVLVVADAPWVFNDVQAALSAPGYDVTEHDDPATAAEAAAKIGADVAVVDLQVGSMGGMAITRDLRDAAELDGGPAIPVVILLDRRADAFLAGRAGASGWLQKPFTANALRTTIADAIAAAAVELEAAE